MSDRQLFAGIDVTDWSEADKLSLRTAVLARAEAEAAAATAEAARTVHESLPSEIIRRAQAEAEAARRQALEETELDKAETKFGRGRVARVRTVEGSILLRAMTLAEVDGAELRAGNLQNAAERVTAHREALLDSAVYPSRAEVQERTSKYPGLWAVLYAARDRLITGIEEDAAGKAVVSISKPAAR